MRQRSPHRGWIRVRIGVIAMLAAAACSSGNSEPGAAPNPAPATRAGGTITVAAEQFPSNLSFGATSCPTPPGQS